MDENKDFLNISDLGAPLPVLDAGLSTEDKTGLVSAPKNKRQSLAGQHSDVFENVNPKVRKRKRVEFLWEIQRQHDELEVKFLEERAKLEAKYQKLYEPLYTKRYEIVNGVVEVESVAKENAEETKNKGLPGFWLTAMKTNDVLTDEIQKWDEKALKFLKDIKWSRIDDPKGFKLEFFFDSNPYFKNSVLTKTYHMINDEPIPEMAIGTEIEWCPGKCLTHKILEQQPKKGSNNAAKPITIAEYYLSFFDFFNTLEYDEEDERPIERDYVIGCTIRDKIIPHAVSWFTGEAARDDDFQDVVGDDDGEDDDEEEDDGDEEEDIKPKPFVGFMDSYVCSADRGCFVNRSSPWPASSTELYVEGTSSCGIPII